MLNFLGVWVCGLGGGGLRRATTLDLLQLTGWVMETGGRVVCLVRCSLGSGAHLAIDRLWSNCSVSYCAWRSSLHTHWVLRSGLLSVDAPRTSLSPSDQRKHSILKQVLISNVSGHHALPQSRGGVRSVSGMKRKNRISGARNGG